MADVRRDRVERAGTWQDHAERLQTSATLAERTDEYAFVNHGLLFTAGGVETDPLLHYSREQAGNCPIVPLVLAQPAFQGIGQAVVDSDTIHFDSVLFAVPRAHLEPIARLLTSIGLFDRQTRTVELVTSCILTVIDRPALDRHTVCPAQMPVVPVHAFGLVSGTRELGFLPDVSGPHACARVVRGPGSTRPAQVAQGLFLPQLQLDPFDLLAQEVRHERIRPADLRGIVDTDRRRPSRRR